MKAYFLYINDDGMDQGGLIVFADTAKEARKQADSKDLQYDSWIDIRAHRDKKYDGMESLSEAELAYVQFQDGWRWVDYSPDDDMTKEQFIEWYEGIFGHHDVTTATSTDPNTTTHPVKNATNKKKDHPHA